MAKSINSWNRFFKDHGIRPKLIKSYLDYILVFKRNKVPVIFSFSHLAKLLGRSKSYLSSVVNSNTNHYRTFHIPKRKGGKREICAPYPALLECQQWILTNILENYELNDSAQAYRKKRSIITNAKIHLSQKCILKLDLEDFFTSIKINRVIALFKEVGYPNLISFYLAKICTYENYLPQGGATSPMISNLVARKLDSRLSGLASKFNYNYSRYADDITFSGPNIPVIIIKYVQEIIESEGFKLNSSKTKLLTDNKRKIVTGLSVSGDSLTVPREYKRKLRQEVYFISKYGYFSHTSKLKISDPKYFNSLIGKMQFWKMVEPKNKYVKSVTEELIKKYRSIKYSDA